MRTKIEYAILMLATIAIWYLAQHALDCLRRIEDTVNKTSVNVENINKTLNDPTQTTINFTK